MKFETSFFHIGLTLDKNDDEKSCLVFQQKSYVVVYFAKFGSTI